MAGLPRCEHTGCDRHPVQFAMTCHEHLGDRSAWLAEALHEIYYFGCVGGYFEHCDFTGADFQRGTLNRANLRHLRAEGSNLAQVVAMEADFSDADLRRIDGKKCVFAESKFDRTLFDGADLERANLEGTDCKNARFVGANLKSSQCHGMHAQGADFARADLSDSSFTTAILQGANLEGCNLARANFSGADLTGCRVVGATGVQLAIVDKDTIGRELLGR